MRFTYSLLFILGVFSQPLKACSCGEWDFDFSVDLADEIFLGRLISIEMDKYPIFMDYYDQVYTFEISKKWMGSPLNQISIYASDGCFPSLQHSNEYIIYAYKDESQFEEILRDRTTLHNYFDTSKLPGYRYTTMYCMRIKNVAWYLEEAPFRTEIAKLDSAFTQPIKLRPYYLNLKNFFLLSILGLSGFLIWRRKRKDPSEVSSG
ncbi:MAG: hypothetical protein F6K19_11450 [Cyanothece sp. SIO1E1]|nr:hypothetical protein [Cyanothece sp. SIO1E1]